MLNKIALALLFFSTLFFHDLRVQLVISLIALCWFYLSKNSFTLLFQKTIVVLPLLIGILILNRSMFYLVFFRTLNAIIIISIVTKNFNLMRLKSILNTVHLPQYLTDIIIMATRFSFTFAQESLKLSASYRLRGGYHKKNLSSAKNLGPLVGNFFIRSVKKSERVYASMKIRGY